MEYENGAKKVRGDCKRVREGKSGRDRKQKSKRRG